MVDWYGNWFEEQDYDTYPAEEWCDYDHMAVWIRKSGYEVKTNMENLITIIFLHYEGELYDGEWEEGETDKVFTIEGCKRFVEESGGLAEFDYYC